MASSDVKDDELLSQLAGLGFQLARGHQALQAGCSTLEEAVNWCVNQDEKKRRHEEPTTVAAPIATTPLSQPVASLGLPSSDGATLVSARGVRPELAAAQEESQRQFRENEAKRLRLDVRKRRQLEEETRRQALSSYKDDRERMKLRAESGTALSATAAAASASQDGTAVAAAVSAGATAKDKRGTAHIKIVLQGSGKELVDMFQASDTLDVVVQRLCEKHSDVNLESVSLIQPYPRRVFNGSQLGESLSSLGLVPSAKLVLKPTLVGEKAFQGTNEPDRGPEVMAQDSVDKENVDEGGGVDEDGGAEEGGDALDDHPAGGHNAAALGLGLPNLGGPNIGGPVVGRLAAHRQAFVNPGDPDAAPAPVFGGANVEMAGLAEADEEEMDDGDEWHEPPPVPRAVFRPPNARGRRRGRFGGAGHQLGGRPEAVNPNNDPQAAVAARRRLLPAGAEPVCPEQVNRKLPKPQGSSLMAVKSLRTLAMGACVQQIPTRLIHQPAFSCAVPPRVANELIVEFQKKATLTKKVLHAFHARCVTDIRLDGYKYATNDLLLVVRKFTLLSVLSLRNCDLLTDAGLAAVRSLPNLEVLDLSGCRRLLTKLETLSIFDTTRKLKVLTLDSCAVSDDKLKHVISHLPALKHLSVCNTNVTSQSLISIGEKLPELRVLHLSSTKVDSLVGIDRLSKLCVLGLNSCSLHVHTFHYVRMLRELSELHLLNVCITSGELTSTLAGLPIRKILLPSVVFTDGGTALVETLAGFGLLEIDLHHLKVEDAALQCLTGSTRLESMILDNTAVTDDGICALRGISSLRKISLNNTNVTDKCMETISELRLLGELCLCRTGITDVALSSGAINKLEFLTYLDLSFTAVSNRGLGCLRLPELETLNIIHTITYSSAPSRQHLFHGCPRLNKVHDTGLVFRTAAPDDELN